MNAHKSPQPTGVSPASVGTPVHFAVEILFDTVFQPACENESGLDCFTEGDPDAEMTDEEGAVTCPDCLRAIGLTEVGVAPLGDGWHRAEAA